MRYTCSRPQRLPLAAALLTIVIAVSCKDSEGPLAPYLGGGQPLSKLAIEEKSFKPRVTWVGGFVSMMGINRGTKAVLDSSLVWLVSVPNNNLRFPVAYGVVPEGGQDLTSSFGGTTLDSLFEDSTYTFWILKEAARPTVLANPGRVLVEDSLAPDGGIVGSDTIRISRMSCKVLTVPLDVFINIDEVRSLGPLAIIQVIPSNIDNHPRFSWTMRTPGTDTLVAALGIVVGSAYNVNALVWEVLSLDTTSGVPVYRKNNVIPSPIVAGQQFLNTEVFTEYPAEGLQRGEYYFFWIANKDWDGIGHQRFTPNHAYVTFRVY